MAFKTQSSKLISTQSRVMRTILEELRLLRNEVRLLLPYEDLEEYANSDRIRRSYQKAVKKHPPVRLWR